MPPLSLFLLLLLLRFVLPTPTAASQTHMKRGFPFSFPFLNFSAAPKRTEGKEQEKKNKKNRPFPHFFPCKIALSAPAQRKENWGETGRDKNKDKNSPNIFQKFYFCKAHQWKSQKLDSMVHFSKNRQILNSSCFPFAAREKTRKSMKGLWRRFSFAQKWGKEEEAIAARAVCLVMH